MTNEHALKPILEGLLFISDSPVRLDTLTEILHEWDREALLGGIQQIKKDCEEDSRGLELVEVAGGYQFRTKPQWAEWINRLKKSKPVKLSQSALETLAIIAYRQPVIRPTIEEIRGVDSGWVIRSLLEKGLIRITGRKEIAGRPLIYGTTKTFLEIFNLNTLSDLPTLKEVEPPPEPETVLKEEGPLPPSGEEGD
jgi:segregation and condensation protein B